MAGLGITGMDEEALPREIKCRECFYRLPPKDKDTLLRVSGKGTSLELLFLGLPSGGSQAESLEPSADFLLLPHLTPVLKA